MFKRIKSIKVPKDIIGFLLTIFLLLTSYSHTVFPLSTPVVGRLAFGELFAVFALLVFFLAYLPKQKIFIPTLAKAFLFLVFTFCSGLIVTQNPVSTITEILILVYLCITYILIINYFKGKAKLVIKLITITTFCSALIGFWDLSATITGLPHLFSTFTSKGRLPAGTFRNGGAAGAFMQASMIIIIPAFTSKFKVFLNKKERRFAIITVVIAGIYIVLNMKVAAIIGVCVSLMLYMIYLRSFKLLFALVLSLGLIVTAVVSLQDINSPIVNRIISKYNTRVVSMIDEDKESSAKGFMEDNYGKAIDVFKQYPMTGSGYGGFFKVFHPNEVHSTPLKIIGETGLIGVIGYTVFMLFFLKESFSHFFIKGPPDEYSDYLKHISVLLVGAFVSWGYTFHLRKRFFWNIIAVLIIMNQAKKSKISTAKQQIV